MRRFWVVIAILILTIGKTGAQVAGINTLSFLRMTTTARSAAVGMNSISLYDPEDNTIGLHNPSLISSNYQNRLVIDYVGLFAGSNMGTVSYGLKSKRLGTFLIGGTYNNYGKFARYDESENYDGDFYAADYSLHVAWCFQIDSSFSIGTTFKPILSQYESYTAFAFSVDVAGTYFSPNRQFALSLIAHNIGVQVVSYDHESERLPFNLSLAGSYTLTNAPFKIFFEIEELTRWNLSYDDALNSSSQIDPYTGEVTKDPWYSDISDIFDEVARHIAIGVEVELNKVIFIRTGYRYRQQVEMSANDRSNMNMSGFSYGIGIRAKRFEFSFARQNYHLGQAPNYLSLSIKL